MRRRVERNHSPLAQEREAPASGRAAEPQDIGVVGFNSSRGRHTGAHEMADNVRPPARRGQAERKAAAPVLEPQERPNHSEHEGGANHG